MTEKCNWPGCDRISMEGEKFCINHVEILKQMEKFLTLPKCRQCGEVVPLGRKECTKCAAARIEYIPPEEKK